MELYCIWHNNNIVLPHPPPPPPHTQVKLDELGSSSMLARNEDIIFTELDDAIVMMDVDEGRYYELDPVAARVWVLVGERRTMRSICDALMEEYDVSAEICEQDTREFVRTAVEMRIMRAEAHLEVGYSGPSPLNGT